MKIKKFIGFAFLIPAPLILILITYSNTIGHDLWNSKGPSEVNFFAYYCADCIGEALLLFASTPLFVIGLILLYLSYRKKKQA